MPVAGTVVWLVLVDGLVCGDSLGSAEALLGDDGAGELDVEGGVEVPADEDDAGGVVLGTAPSDDRLELAVPVELEPPAEGSAACGDFFVHAAVPSNDTTTIAVAARCRVPRSIGEE
jgi:hypothetical protein